MRRFSILALAMALAAALTVPAFAQEASRFGDVPDSHWAAAAIRRANDDGVMVGTGALTEAGLARFEPDAELTSAQFAVIVTNAFYRDIPEAAGPWYAPFRKAMEDAGWDEGAGIRDWTAPMTRYQMAAVLYNIAKDRGVPLPDGENLEAARGRIADWARVPEEYQTAVAASYALDLLSGVDGSGAFAGEQTLSRAQAAAVYVRLAGVIPEDGREPDADPMQARLDQLIASVEEWNRITGGEASTYKLYPGSLGTVFAGRKAGVLHGGGVELFFVRTDGTTLDILNLLPSYFMYGANYASPSHIQVNGDRLTFVTPVKEGDAEANTEKDWGDTLCTVDLTSGTMVSMEPVQRAKLWLVTLEEAPTAGAVSDALTVTLVKESGEDEPAVRESNVPFAGMTVDLSDFSVYVTQPEALLDDSDFAASGYGRAVRALLDLELPERNTAAQQEQVGKYVQVMLNGEPVSGHLYFSTPGDGTVWLWFTTVQALQPMDGDTITVRIGLPQN